MLNSTRRLVSVDNRHVRNPPVLLINTYFPLIPHLHFSATMLHRPADSRLLANLLSHEKDYTKALNVQLDVGHASLASFSAYAAASPPPASRAIAAVAGALVGAQDALRSYALAVDEWCEQLRMLKELEDEVGNIVRDREIL